MERFYMIANKTTVQQRPNDIDVSTSVLIDIFSNTKCTTQQIYNKVKTLITGIIYELISDQMIHMK